MHPPLSRVHAGVWRVLNSAVFKLAVRASALRRLRRYLRCLCGRMREVQRYGDDAKMRRGLPSLCQVVPGSCTIRSCSKGRINTPNYSGADELQRAARIAFTRTVWTCLSILTQLGFDGARAVSVLVEPAQSLPQRLNALIVWLQCPDVNALSAPSFSLSLS
jgi:hypothetical protein